MNLTTRAQSKPQSPKTDSKTSTPQSQSDSPRPSSAPRKRATGLAETKSKRVRTGCLTCRERHLKCDEALGRCLNCQKSDRICRRGVRLNFIDIQTVAPPHVVARPKGAKVTFRDDSRFIASEYVGGFERYPPPRSESPVEERRQLLHGEINDVGTDDLTNLFQSVAHSFDPVVYDHSHSAAVDFFLEPETWHESHLVPGNELLPQGTSEFARRLGTQQYSSSNLVDPEQAYLLQVFVEEVGPTMDLMDPAKHFTEILPLYAIDEPILLNALLACGARYLSLKDAAYSGEKAAHYYDAATQDLMSAIHDPNRDSVLCAIAALALAFYDRMTLQSGAKVNHVSGSRALIHECGWTAKSPGLGGACFWTSVGMELLNCLQRSLPLSWNPDIWGVDLDMDQMHFPWKGEELWLHRIVYLCAKAQNLRVSVSRMQALDDPTLRNTQLHDAFQEWKQYKYWCDQWFNTVPRAMKPLVHLQPWRQDSRSTFPKVWLVKPIAILSQLFYHTTCILLARTHLLQPDAPSNPIEWQQSNASDLCGIAMNIKDYSLAPVAVSCLTIAAECIETRASQEELLEIIEKILQRNLWYANFIRNDLTRLWEWPLSCQETVDPVQMHHDSYQTSSALSVHDSPEIQDDIYLLSSTGDISTTNHPYQEFYVAPHHYHYGSYLV